MARARLRGMAALLDERGVGETLDLSFTPPPFLRRFLCGCAQAAALPVIIGLSTSQWLGIFVTYMLISGEDLALPAQIAALLGVYVAITIVTGFIAIGAEMARARPDEARRLSALGRVLFPLVVRLAHRRARAHQVAAGARR